MEKIKPKKERKFLKAMGDIALTLFRELILGIGKKVINKVGNKRQGLVIVFLLVAGISYASIDSIPYPVTGNKQRLGWQTSGNGLVYRGRSNDTITKPSSYVDKNVKAYLLLDSVRGTIFVWRQTYWDSIKVNTRLMPFDSITFNTAKNGTVGVGEVEYNDTQGSLIQGLKGGNVTNVIGQQLHQRVNNRTGAPLAKGDVVYLSGSQGNRITVAKGLAVTDAFSANTFGVVAEAIADNQSGFIITEGLITGLNTSALTEDSAVYLSPTVAGALTSTKPQAPQHTVYIGVCVKSSNGSGELFIKIRNGLEMDELHDTRITNPVTGATLYYSGGLWRDTTAALLVSDTAAMLTPYFRDADTSLLNLTSRFAAKLNLSDTSNMLVPYLRKADTTNMLLPYFRDADTATLSNRINLKLNISDTSAFARDNQISGTSGQVAYFNSTSSVVSDTALRWSAANKSLGINMTTTPSGANLILKNSQEPSRATVVTTQGFAADTTNWTRGTGWTFNGTQAVATAATGNLTYTPSLTITSGNAYEITYTLTNYSAGTLTVILGNGTAIALPTYNVTGYAVLTLPTSATGGFRFTTSTFTGNLDDITVVQISNPAPVLFAGQDDGSATLYSSLRMPNSTTFAFGGGATYTTGSNNAAIGVNALRANTTGSNNIGNGAGALQSNTTGSNNVANGESALQNNTKGISNVANGVSALRANTTGSNNVANGAGALQTNTTGDGNVANGQSALQNNTTGSDNIANGVNALLNNTTGNLNVANGSSALRNNTTGSKNVANGVSALRGNTTGSNNIATGESALHNPSESLTGSDNIAIGAFAADNIRSTATRNVVIGSYLDLPVQDGSYQGVYQNALFITGASGTGTTIAAASKAGIKTSTPNRDLEVAGEVRITDLTTDAPTRLVGADADGDLGQVTLGSTLSLTGSSLGVTSNTFLPLTGGTLTGGLTGTTGSFGTIGGNIAWESGNFKIQPYNNYPSENFGIIFNSLSATETMDFYWFGYSEQPRRAFRFIDGSTDSEKMRIEPFTGNVGINQTVPSYKLDVNGTLGVTGATTLSAPLTVNSSAVFNEGSTDSDFRVESDGNANMVFVDASTDRVGIGYASPTKTLDVNGEVRINTVTATPTSLLGKDGSNVVGEVTTVAQTGLMTRGETTATTGSPSAIFTVTHGLGSTPTSVLVTSAGLAGSEKIIYEVYSKNSTTFSVQAWNYDGTEALSKSVKIFWLAIK